MKKFICRCGVEGCGAQLVITRSADSPRLLRVEISGARSEVHSSAVYLSLIDQIKLFIELEAIIKERGREMEDEIEEAS